MLAQLLLLLSQKKAVDMHNNVYIIKKMIDKILTICFCLGEHTLINVMTFRDCPPTRTKLNEDTKRAR